MIALIWLLAYGLASAGEMFDPAYRDIVPADNVRKFLAQSGCAPLPDRVAGKFSDTWTPSANDVEFLEASLPSALRKSIRETNWIGPKSREILTQYRSIVNHARQYAGIIIDGRKMILVVAAPRYFIDFDGRHDMEMFADIHWHEHPIGACDGGPDDFTVLYDLQDKQFGKFEFSCTFAGCSVP